MATTADPNPIDRYPPELVRAVVQEAAVEADMVGTFLTALGLTPAGTGKARKPLYLPAPLLLGLGAAMRLLRWEVSGLLAHLPPDLPPSQEVVYRLFTLAASTRQTELEALARELTLRVFTVWLERFAWGSRELWDADFVLGDAEEDELVEVLAAFLWAHRNSSPSQQSGGGT